MMQVTQSANKLKIANASIAALQDDVRNSAAKLVRSKQAGGWLGGWVW